MTSIAQARGERSSAIEPRDHESGPYILHVVDSLQPGGAQRIVIALTQWLVTAGFRVGVVGADGAYRDRLAAGVDFGPTSSRPSVGELLRVTRSTGAGLLHAHQRREALMAHVAGALTGIPVVEHAHTELPRTGVKALSFRGRRTYAVSPGVRDMVVDRFSREPGRVRLIRNLPATPVIDADALAQPVRADGTVSVLGIGRMVAQKDPLRFVSIVAELAKLGPVRARWLGDGPLRGPSIDLAERLRAPIEFPGLTDDIAGELDEADALLMTSRWEGEPLAALEAHSRGKVVFSPATIGVEYASSEARARYVFDEYASGSFVAQQIMAVASRPALLRSDGLAGRELMTHDSRQPAHVYAPIAEDYRKLARRHR